MKSFLTYLKAHTLLTMTSNIQPPLPEVWLRGPVEGVPALLQPVAHTWLQASEEIPRLLDGFPEELLWERPEGVASVAFHLRHICGVVDRLATYAKGAGLDATQLAYLAAEGTIDNAASLGSLLDKLKRDLHEAVETLKEFDEGSLTAFRGVGRKQLPSTVLGLLFHAAEHTMRHMGQLLVTARVLKAGMIQQPA